MSILILLLCHTYFSTAGATDDHDFLEIRLASAWRTSSYIAHVDEVASGVHVHVAEAAPIPEVDMSVDERKLLERAKRVVSRTGIEPVTDG